ncbi:PDF receptor-like [Haliotis rufescens]|uniref:PDF receptor-like n=1 Tax=Haliotis rufescens TaxID=6454 RepID=UPI00201F1DB6|nr:PDF receptor-like [Haliotis rufescens]
MATSDARAYQRLVACLKTLKGSRAEVERFCPTSFDGVLCWPPTLPGMTVRQRCPKLWGFISRRYAYRTCGPTSTWVGFTKSSTIETESKILKRVESDGDGLTDYTGCINYTMEMAGLPPRYTGVSEMAGVTAMEILGYTLKSLSILTLFVAVCLYGCCVRAKTQRYKIFIPMFLSSMMKYVVSLVDIIVWRFETDFQQTTVWRHPVVCKCANSVTRFSELSVYSWIAVLGVYYLFAVLGDIIKGRRVMVLYLVGLGIPVVFATAWALTVTFVLSTDVCEGGQIPHATHWITDAPKLACVLIAFCIFIVCVYAAFRGLIDDDVLEFRLVKQGTIKCLLFLTLCTSADLYLLVIVYNNGGQTIRVSSADSWIDYFTLVVDSIPGVIMAILLCFVDNEVRVCENEPRKVNVVVVERGREHNR